MIFFQKSIIILTEKEVSPFIQEVLFTNHAESMNEVLNRDYDIHLNYNSLIMGYKISKRFKTVFDLADDIPAMIRHSPQIPSFEAFWKFNGQILP